MSDENMMKQFARPEVTHEVELDEGNKAVFRIIKWKPTKVIENIPKIGKVFAVPFSMVATATGEEGETLNSLLPMALIQFFSTMDEIGINTFFKMILEDVYLGGVKVTDKYDEIFIEHPEIILELVAKVVEIHYAPFFKKGFGNLLSSMNLATKMDQIS